MALILGVLLYYRSVHGSDIGGFALALEALIITVLDFIRIIFFNLHKGLIYDD